jgi:hypothetical protein
MRGVLRPSFQRHFLQNLILGWSVGLTNHFINPLRRTRRLKFIIAGIMRAARSMRWLTGVWLGHSVDVLATMAIGIPPTAAILASKRLSFV